MHFALKIKNTHTATKDDPVSHTQIVTGRLTKSSRCKNKQNCKNVKLAPSHFPRHSSSWKWGSTVNRRVVMVLLDGRTDGHKRSIIRTDNPGRRGATWGSFLGQCRGSSGWRGSPLGSQTLKKTQIIPWGCNWVTLRGSWIHDHTRIHLARLQVMRLWPNHRGSAQSASYKEVLAATGAV